MTLSAESLEHLIGKEWRTEAKGGDGTCRDLPLATTSAAEEEDNEEEEEEEDEEEVEDKKEENGYEELVAEEDVCKELVEEELYGTLLLAIK